MENQILGMQPVVAVGVITLVTIFIVAVLRFFWCWYFKIDRLVELLEKQNDLLLRLCKYEKYRMIEDGHIDQEKFQFVKWGIDNNLKVTRKGAAPQKEEAEG